MLVHMLLLIITPARKSKHSVILDLIKIVKIIRRKSGRVIFRIYPLILLMSLSSVFLRVKKRIIVLNKRKREPRQRKIIKIKTTVCI